MTLIHRVEHWADLADGIAKMQLAGTPSVPLYQALGRGEIALLPMSQPGSSAKFRKWSDAVTRLPGIVLVGDDAETQPDGPDAWPVARRVMAWAHFVLIHGARGEPGHYEFALGLAHVHRRLVMIECSSSQIDPWQAAAQRWAKGATGQVIRPVPGCLHPAPRTLADVN